LVITVILTSQREVRGIAGRSRGGNGCGHEIRRSDGVQIKLNGYTVDAQFAAVLDAILVGICPNEVADRTANRKFDEEVLRSSSSIEVPRIIMAIEENSDYLSWARDKCSPVGRRGV